MTYPVDFGGLAAGDQPLSLIDTMFTVAGQQGNIPCTATGTNAITLTPGTNFFVPAAYSNAQIASFMAANTSSGSVTLQIGGLALLKLFTAAGVQAASGDVVANTHYEIQYWADLDSSSGGFIILNATVTAIANPLQGQFTGLRIANDVVTPNTKTAVSCDAAILQNVSGGTVRVTSVTLTINAGTSGANGLDTGSLANSTFYAVYIIFNANTLTTAGLVSTSGTSPTLPAGYTYFARVGWILTDSSAHYFRIEQFGRKTQFTITVGSNTTDFFPIASGSNSGVATASTVTTCVPTSTALEIVVQVVCPASGAVSVGATTATNSATAISMVLPAATSVTFINQFLLETTTISYTSNVAGGAVKCVGWVDNL